MNLETVATVFGHQKNDDDPMNFWYECQGPKHSTDMCRDFKAMKIFAYFQVLLIHSKNVVLLTLFKRYN